MSDIVSALARIKREEDAYCNTGEAQPKPYTSEELDDFANVAALHRLDKKRLRATATYIRSLEATVARLSAQVTDEEASRACIAAIKRSIYVDGKVHVIPVRWLLDELERADAKLAQILSLFSEDAPEYTAVYDVKADILAIIEGNGNG